MAYAGSAGLRFLFFWKYIGLSLTLHEEGGSLGKSQSRKPRQPQEWSQWGTAGLVIKFIALAATLSILVLQIVWRFGLVLNISSLVGEYTADTSIEILFVVLAAVVLMYQIFAGVLPSDQPKWEAGCLALALFIHAGTGVGGLIIGKQTFLNSGTLF